MTSPPPFHWLTDSSEMGERIRSLDWSQTVLGPSESWSPALRMMVRLLLVNRFPMLLWWGPEYISLYNDPYRPILGAKHPQALGQPVRECWSEIWHVLQPLIDTPFHGGPSTWDEDIELEINRHGFVEETHFAIAYSPVPDETVASGIGGVLATVHEITEKVIGERRVVALRDLGARASDAKSVDEACRIAAQTLALHPKDVSFALLYLIDADGRFARLAGCAGCNAGGMASPALVDLRLEAEQPWPLANVRNLEKLQVIDNLTERLGTAIPLGPWSDPPQQAVLVPIRSSVAHQPAGVLVAGVSARLALDELYCSFLELVAGQIATAVANAGAFEAERKRAEALAQIDQAKTVFFSNVSHELRTPLTLILAPLQDALVQNDFHWSRERVEMIHRNAQRLQKLVNTILDFSRIEAGRLRAHYQRTDIVGLTVELASVFRAAVEKAGLRLIVHCPPLEQTLFVDRDMYEKIVLNLLSNAFKFTLEGEIEVRLRDAGEMVELCVRDTGCGIAASELPHVFERFHRIENARARTLEGTGIGLALVQELTRLHGGTVTVASEPGAGSTFTVSLRKGISHLPADHIETACEQPSTALAAGYFLEEALRWLPPQVSRTGSVDRALAVAETDVPPLAQIPGSSAPATRARIVWADDNSDMRDYVGRLLGSRYEVEAVSTGDAALAAVRRLRPELVLTDVMMPGLDGFGLLRALRSDEYLRMIPVVMLSARAGEDARVEGLQAGADDYLVKPFTARELLARVDAHIEMGRLRRAHDAFASADLQAMTRLYELGNRCAGAGNDMQGCLDAIVDTAIALTGAARGNLQILDQRDGTLKIAAQRGFSEAFQTFDAIGTNGVSSGAAVVQSTSLISGTGAGLGAICLHFDRSRGPGERELRRMDLLARQAADYLERKQAEHALQVSEMRYRNLFDSIDEGYCIVQVLFDAQGLPHDYIFEEVNQSFERQTGISNAVGRSMRDIEPDHDAHWFEVYGRIALSGRAERFVSFASALNRWYDVYAFRFGEPAERRVAILFQDISEHKAAIEALRAGEERLRAIIEQLPAGVGVMNLDGKWTLSNSLMEKYVPQAIPSTLPDRIPHWRSWDAQGNLIAPEHWPGKRALRGETVMPGMEMLYTDDVIGEFWMRVSASPLRDDNDIIGACVVALDITQIKTAERALREADRRKDEFLATLAHELRNPLAPIRNGLHILRQTGDHSGRIARVHEILESQVTHMVRLVDDLMEVSRITGGKVELRKEQIDLSVVLRSAVEISEPLINAAHHRFSIDLPADPLVVDVDPVRLAQVIANLLNNAAKYTEKKGEIRLTAHRENDTAVVCVRDNGIGIPMAMLPKVFDLFMQVEPTFDRTQGGLGIGLTLVRSLVKLHGGSVEARSEGSGRGSEFLVRLPLVAQPQWEANALPPDIRGVARPSRILVVDDNRDAGDTLAIILKSLGAEVHVVRDGAAALAALNTHRVEVVLLDIGMPEMDGYEVARRLRQRSGFDDIKLIALTGWGQEEDRRRSKEAGFDHHLVKPVDINMLERLLTQLALERECQPVAPASSDLTLGSIC